MRSPRRACALCRRTIATRLQDDDIDTRIPCFPTRLPPASDCRLWPIVAMHARSPDFRVMWIVWIRTKDLMELPATSLVIVGRPSQSHVPICAAVCARRSRSSLISIALLAAT